ncbi:MULTISPECIES: hypothetical protein [unclassified Geodermatophilus]
MDDTVHRTTRTTRAGARGGRGPQPAAGLEITGWHRDAARFLAGCIGTGALLGAAVAAVREPRT